MYLKNEKFKFFFFAICKDEMGSLKKDRNLHAMPDTGFVELRSQKIHSKYKLP